MSEFNNLKCPKCGKEMYKGYIYSTRSLNWSTNQKKFSYFGDETLAAIPIFTPKKLPALRCLGCSIVLFDYKG